MRPKIARARDSARRGRSGVHNPGGVDEPASLTTLSVSEPEVDLLDVRALLERRPWPLEHDAAVLDHVSAMRERERARHVLLDEQNGSAARVDRRQDLED